MDTDKLSEEVDRGFRYAALNLAALHANFQVSSKFKIYDREWYFLNSSRFKFEKVFRFLLIILYSRKTTLPAEMFGGSACFMK